MPIPQPSLRIKRLVVGMLEKNRLQVAYPLDRTSFALSGRRKGELDALDTHVHAEDAQRPFDMQ
jgi:hypothetical protein